MRQKICKNPTCTNKFNQRVHNQVYCSHECKREMDNRRKRNTPNTTYTQVDDEGLVLISDDQYDESEELEFLRKENRRLNSLALRYKYKKNEEVEAMYRAMREAVGKLEIKPVKPPSNLRKAPNEEVSNPALSDFQCGKALDDETEVLTTEGWKRHGDISTGDFVYSPSGKPVKVLAVTGSSVQECYEVNFDSGASVIASKDHLWEGYRRYKKRPDNVYERRSLIWTTEEIASLRQMPNINGTLHTDRAFHVDVSEPLWLEEDSELPIDPYILGYWLGDGFAASGRLCGDLDSMEFVSEYLGGVSVLGGRIKSDGTREAYRVTVPGLQSKLRQSGLLNSKRIPEVYLLANYENRLALLQGLLDSDGSIDNKGRVEFSASSHPELAESVKFLLSSLGMKASIKVTRSQINGDYKKDRHRVCFTTHDGFSCFRLPRKVAKIRQDSAADAIKFRYIQNTVPVGLRSAQCLTVEGGLYLVTRDLITTHNCTPSYNSDILAQRIELFGEKIDKITQIQRSDHPVNKVHIHALGDIVEGEDIFPTQVYEIDTSLYQQIINSVEITADFLRKMLSIYEEVHFAGVIGNHGRLNKRNAGGYNPESNMDRLVYKFVSMLFANEKRITFNIPDGYGRSNFYLVDHIGNYSTMLLHGDQFSAPTSGHSYVKKVLGWKDSGIDEDFMDVICGHYHQNTKMTIGNTTLRIAGTPESDNQYASEKLGVMGRPSQHLQFVSPKKGCVTAEYDVFLDD